ncbi:hypothetical protein J0852_04415 [Bacillus paranthracis]
MKNLSASAVTKERSISRGHGGLKNSMYFYLENIQGVKKHGMFNKWCLRN